MYAPTHRADAGARRRRIITTLLVINIGLAAAIPVYLAIGGPLPAAIDPERRAVGAQLAEFTVQADVLFAHDSSDLLPAATETLDSIAEYLQQSPEFGIVVTGHADSTGDPAYNVDLSQRRAEAVVAYLTEAGVGNPITPVGKGDIEPVADNATADGRAANRRVEFALAE